MKRLLSLLITAFAFATAASVGTALSLTSDGDALGALTPEIRAFLLSKEQEGDTAHLEKYTALTNEIDAIRTQLAGATTAAGDETNKSKARYLNAGLERMMVVGKICADYERAVADGKYAPVPPPAAKGLWQRTLDSPRSRNALIAGIVGFLLAAVCTRKNAKTTGSAEPDSPSALPVLPVAKKENPRIIELPKGRSLELLPVPAGSVAIILEGEHARREVRVPHPFWLGKYEVTQEQYKAVTGDNPSQNKGDNLPVENLRWEDAVEFCRRLTEQERERGNLPEGYVYGLPTEDEWLFAATAGGDDKNAKGWDAKNSAGRTHAVGTQPPNAWGFYDMAGNVGEMCADNAVGNLSPGAPLRPLDTHDRIVRGSTINTRAQSSLHRDAISKNEANPATGFRLALRRIS